MSEKAWRRIRLLLFILGIAGFTFYFAFRTFVFDPLEGSFGMVPAVVPRTVDFYVRKLNLADDFTIFPEPRFFAALGRTEGWDRFLNSEDYRRLDGSLRIEAGLAELEKNLAQLPIDLLGDAIGRELIVVGRKREGSQEITDFAVYARVSWKVKLGLGLLRYEWIRSRFAPQLQMVETGDEIWKLRGAGSKDLFLWRDRDLVVLGTEEWFLRKAQELLAARGEDSLGLSAKYADEIQRFTGRGNEVELLLDLEPFVKRHFGRSEWPVVSWQLPGRIAAELLTPETIREGLAVLRFEPDELQMRAHLYLDSTNLSPFQSRLYGSAPMNLAQEVLEKAKMAPARTFLFVTFAADVLELLRALERALDDGQRRLVNDQIRSVGPYRDLRQLIDEFGPAFRRNVVLMLRRNDFPKLQDDPPNDGSPDPCWAVALSIKSDDKVNDLIGYFNRNSSAFGVEKMFHFDAAGGFKATEFASQLIPATGEIAVLPAGDTLLVSNSPKYLREILKHRFGSSPAGSLAGEPGFAERLAQMEPSSNAFVYGNAHLYEEVLREQIPFLAARMFRIDYGAERVKARERIIREKFPEYRNRPLPPETERAVQKLVDGAINDLEVTMRGPGIQKIRAELENYAHWMTSFPELFLSLSSDPKSLTMDARVRIDWR